MGNKATNIISDEPFINIYTHEEFLVYGIVQYICGAPQSQDWDQVNLDTNSTV